METKPLSVNGFRFSRLVFVHVFLKPITMTDYQNRVYLESTQTVNPNTEEEGGGWYLVLTLTQGRIIATPHTRGITKKNLSVLAEQLGTQLVANSAQ